MNDTTTTPKYAGTWKSAIARAKKVLVAAGFPWSVTAGRYTPFFNRQTTTKGVRVTRVGCSDTVSMSVWGYVHSTSEADREIVRWMQALAIQAMREAGLPVDDRGWIDCAVRSY